MEWGGGGDGVGGGGGGLGQVIIQFKLCAVH